MPTHVVLNTNTSELRGAVVSGTLFPKELKASWPPKQIGDGRFRPLSHQACSLRVHAGVY